MPDITEKLSCFEESFELTKLENVLRWPNIFTVLGVSRTEIRHSNVLAWLLNPRANHGLDDTFLRELCNAVNINVDGIDLSGVDIRREVHYPKQENTMKERQIDLLIIHDLFVIVLENKIDAIDGPAQLRDYHAIAETVFPKKKRYYVYMTPQGDDPADEAAGADWRLYSYERLCGHIHHVLNDFYAMEPDDDDPQRPGLNDIQKRVQMYLDNYSETIRRHILESDNHLIELASELYRAHKEAIDFIIENRTAANAGLFDLFAGRVEKSGWTKYSSGASCVRFLTPALDPVIPRKGLRSGRESFLFELFFYPGKVVFKATIFGHSLNDQHIKDILVEAVKSVPGSQEPRGEKDIVPILVRYPFSAGEDDTLPAAAPEAQLDTFWPRLETLVKQVEAAILLRAAELEQALKRLNLQCDEDNIPF